MHPELELIKLNTPSSLASTSLRRAQLDLE